MNKNKRVIYWTRVQVKYKYQRNKRSNKGMKRILKVLLITAMVICLTPIGVYAKSYKCIAGGCNNYTYGSSIYCYKHECKKCTKKATNNGYCSTHKPKTSTKSTTSKSKSYSNSSKKKSYNKSYDSYDKGYEDVWLNDDYDWNRYQNDWDYALGVDDAMDDFDYDW